jgi:hypothetical protein
VRPSIALARFVVVRLPDQPEEEPRVVRPRISSRRHIRLRSNSSAPTACGAMAAVPELGAGHRLVSLFVAPGVEGSQRSGPAASAAAGYREGPAMRTARRLSILALTLLFVTARRGSSP